MSLIEVPFNIRERAIPASVQHFIDDATERVRVFSEEREIQVNGFVPSDFDVVFPALQSLAESDLATGDVFCEWGSGFGVVAMMASLLEFQAYGIEIDEGLCTCARLLAEDFDLPVDFVAGSFIPAGGEELVDSLFTTSESWLTGTSDDAYDQLGMSLSDFDVVYAFPWPGEHDVVAALFDEYASVGALLLTFDQLEGIRVRRKVLGKR